MVICFLNDVVEDGLRYFALRKLFAVRKREGKKRCVYAECYVLSRRAAISVRGKSPPRVMKREIYSARGCWEK